MTHSEKRYFKKHKDEYSRFCGIFGKIYTLSDMSGNVFYVGATIQPMRLRLACHISDAKHAGHYPEIATTLKNRKIIALNFQIQATVIETKWVTSTKRAWCQTKLKDTEQKWIKKYQQLGYALCNKEANPNPKKITLLEPDFVGKTITVNSAGKIA